MKRVLGSLWLVLVSFTLISAQELATTDQRPLAFTHVTVIDTSDGPAQTDMTVIVLGKRIATVGKASSTNVPVNTVVINATNKFMIPGTLTLHLRDHRAQTSSKLRT
jgi:imidazolonepropionase-like amidohydrolase